MVFSVITKDGAPAFYRAYALGPKWFLTAPQLLLLLQPCHNLLIFRIVTKGIECFISCNHGSIGKAFLDRCVQRPQRLLLVAIGSVGPGEVEERAGSIGIDFSR